MLNAGERLTSSFKRKIMKLLRVLEFALNRPLKGADDSYEGFNLLGGVICSCLRFPEP